MHRKAWRTFFFLGNDALTGKHQASRLTGATPQPTMKGWGKGDKGMGMPQGPGGSGRHVSSAGRPGLAGPQVQQTGMVKAFLSANL